VDLKCKKSLEVGILLVGVGEVRTFFAIQVGFNVVTFAFYHDGIPVIPFEEAITLLSERVFDFSRSLFVGV
jgi:hypothetical protein